jgi:hypothetical protein
MARTKTRPATAATAAAFTWNPDADQTYDGDKYGSNTLEGTYTSFNKVAGRSFTMKGDGIILTLSPTGAADDFLTIWGCVPNGQESFETTQITVEEKATLQFIPKQTGPLLPLGAIFFTDENAAEAQVTADISGTLLFQDVETTANDITNTSDPAATINVNPTGSFRVANSLAFTGGYYINAHGPGQVTIAASSVDIENGNYILDGNSTATSPTLKMAAFNVTGDTQSGSLNLSNQQITCQEASVGHFESRIGTYADSNVIARDAASMLIACDAITLDSATVFAVGPGTNATITFAGIDGRPAPFDFKDPSTYPGKYFPGMFNFLANQQHSDNKGKFIFRGMSGSAFVLQ